ncbi:hypothetical protein C8F04DRAFT_964527 [Mycena alexandri]|uniref:DUF6533 domain-containing protein n=1 Tax=Mycena alexandri TaxID=1745969 RepID=A0AAD6SJ40_9AGAR|nr:hypothetical protein C8F04DRAFT_964527 [Mycena alexandri]
MYFVGCFALLFFDFFLTLADEVECIWKGKKTTKPILSHGFLYHYVVRYVLQVDVRSLSFHPVVATDWSFSCNRFAIVEWLQTLLIVVPAEMVLLLRVFALTNRNKHLFAFLTSIIIVQCVIVFYAMSIPGTNNALVLPHVPIDSFHVCILFSDPKMDSAYLSTSIAYDCIVFAITLISTATQRSKTSILSTIRRDGTIYFCAILSGNVVWMALAINGRPGLKLLNAQYVSLDGL